MQERLTEEQFTLLAIEKLAKEPEAPIHTVYSGFNDAFRNYFPGVDPIKAVQKLVEEKKIAFRYSKGGAVIGKPGSITIVPRSPKETLGKMGLNKT